MKSISAAIFALFLLTGSVNASDTNVPLRDYVERIVEELNLRNAQEQRSARTAIEAALMAEIRRQDEERNARFALKEEVTSLKKEVTSLKMEVTRLNIRILGMEGSQGITYVGIIVLALLGAANLIGMFWRNR